MKQKKKLTYYGGQGWDNSPEIGKFEISIYPDVEVVENDENGLSPLETKKFNKKSEAKAFFDNYKGQKSAWDKTHLSEFIDAYNY